MFSFKAKIGLKRPRKKEQQLPFRFVPTRRIIENTKKIEKKFGKFKNIVVASFQATIGWNRPRETGKIKIIISFGSNPTRNRKFIKNSKKIQKIRKKQLWLLFKHKLVENGRERDKNTNYRFVSFLPNA